METLYCTLTTAFLQKNTLNIYPRRPTKEILYLLNFYNCHFLSTVLKGRDFQHYSLLKRLYLGRVEWFLRLKRRLQVVPNCYRTPIPKCNVAFCTGPTCRFFGIEHIKLYLIGGIEPVFKNCKKLLHTVYVCKG